MINISISACVQAFTLTVWRSNAQEPRAGGQDEGARIMSLKDVAWIHFGFHNSYDENIF